MKRICLCENIHHTLEHKLYTEPNSKIIFWKIKYPEYPGQWFYHKDLASNFYIVSDRQYNPGYINFEAYRVIYSNPSGFIDGSYSYLTNVCFQNSNLIQSTHSNIKNRHEEIAKQIEEMK